MVITSHFPALTQAAPPALLVVALLGLHNLIYVGIPLVLFGIYLLKGDKARSLMANINSRIGQWIKRIMKVAFFIPGLVLPVDFIGYLFGHPLFLPQ